MTEPPVAIRLLGPVDIVVEGRPLRVDTRKAIATLAYLAMTERPVSRETLGALLWPESADGDARGALRRTLSVLNAGLGGRGIAIDRSSVVLRDADVDVDRRAFREALAKARGHGHDPGLACATCDRWLEAALALDRGPFMDGFALRDSEPFDEWQLGEAESHRRDLAAVLERLARSRLAAGAWDRALTVGRRWLELDPLHEPAHRLLMAGYAAAGETVAAVRQYRECVRILDAELGVAPLEETSELYAAIRAGEATGMDDSMAAVGDQSTAPDAASIAPGATPISPDAEPPLVGRAGALERLLAAVRAIGPDGRLLVIEGEPGIGKTRLARALLERVERTGATVIEARAYVGETTIPYAPIAELVRAGLARPDAADRLAAVPPDRLAEVARLVPMPGVRAAIVEPGDALGRTRLLDALAEVLVALVAGPRPGLVWLDDAHWADASSIEALAFLVRRLRQRPIGVLLAWRREDLADASADEIVTAAAGEGRAEIIALERLSRDEVGTLAEAVLGPAASPAHVDRLFAESEGLPLYLAEAIATPDGDRSSAPGGIDSLVRRRLATLSEIARQVLAAAAVIGRSFDLELVRAASGRGEDEAVAAIEELNRRGIVREIAVPDGARHGHDFTHARLREVAYADLGLARRRLLHRRVAEALAGAAAGREEGVVWPLTALHERLAGRTEAAAEAHRRAGEQARAVHAHAEAREHLEAALALGHPAVGELHEALGHVLTFMADYRGAIAHLEAAASTVGPDRLPAIEHQLGRVQARRGAWDRAETHLAAALATVDERDAALRSAILADRSVVAHRRGDAEAAERAAEEALAVAVAPGAETATRAETASRAAARAEDVLGMLARGRRDLPSARAHLERALAAAPDSDPGLRVAALNTLALVLADDGETERAIELAREALDRCERLGDRHVQAALENNLADLLHAAGREEESMTHLRRAVTIFSEIGGQADELEPEIWKLVEW